MAIFGPTNTKGVWALRRHTPLKFQTCSSVAPILLPLASVQ
jgi:hypothetical protein